MLSVNFGRALQIRFESRSNVFSRRKSASAAFNFSLASAPLGAAETRPTSSARSYGSLARRRTDTGRSRVQDRQEPVLRAYEMEKLFKEDPIGSLDGKNTSFTAAQFELADVNIAFRLVALLGEESGFVSASISNRLS